MPMMPSRLPQMRWPSIQVGDQPVHLRSLVSTVAPSASRRGTIRISAMVMSAVSSVRTPGVLVTVMPCSTALATSILSTPLPKFAISLSWSPALPMHGVVDAVGDGRHQHVGGLHRLDQLGLRHRLVVGVEPRVEQLAHADLDGVRQLARHHDQRSFRSRHRVASGVWHSGIAARLSAARSGLFNRCSSTLHPSIFGGVRAATSAYLSTDGRGMTSSHAGTCVRCVTMQSCSWLLSCGSGGGWR